MDSVQDHRLRHEVLSMGLYVCITLLAALTVTSVDREPDLEVLAIVWGTTLGLALAHWVAFALAARLLDPSVADPHIDRQLVGQLAAALVVAVVASVPIFVLPEDLEISGTRFAVALLIGSVVYAESRSGGSSRARALTAAIVMLAIALVVAGIKHALTH